MDQEVRFGRHRFDPRTRRLWLGKRKIRLTPKAAAVLSVLVERAGQPVTRDELLAGVWGGTVVSDAALTACVQELRQGLRGRPQAPTVHRNPPPDGLPVRRPPAAT